MFGLKLQEPNICANKALTTEVEERGILLEETCKYIQELYDDQLIIHTTMTGFTGARIIMEYEVVRKVDSLLAKVRPLMP